MHNLHRNNSHCLVKHVALKDQTIHKKFIGLLLYKQIAKNVVTFHLVVVEDLEPYLKVRLSIQCCKFIFISLLYYR